MNNRTLFTIGDDLLALKDLLDECDAELTREAAEAFDDWFAEISANESQKLDAYIGLIRVQEMEEAAAKEEAERFLMKARSRGNSVKRLKERIKGYMEATERAKITTASGRVLAIQANGGNVPVEYIGGEGVACAVLPEELIVTIRRPDTDAVRKALASGAEFPGIVLGQRGSHLRVR